MTFKKNKKYKCQQGGPVFNEASYKAFGSDARTAFEEGWMPQASSAGSTTYYNRYGLLNSVNIPNQQQRGHVALVGHDNGQFDIMTTDSSNKPFGEYIQKGGSLQDVNNYFKSNGSVIKKRADSILDNTYAKTNYKEGGFVVNTRKR